MKRLFEGPITFVEEGHEYFVDLDGETKKMPSLSSLLRKKGLVHEYDSEIHPAIMAKAAARGTSVHKAAHALLEGREWEVAEAHLPYVHHAKKLIDKYKMEAVYAEVPLYNPVFEYCTTPDFVGTLNGKSRKGPAIVDWKTSSVCHWEYGFQVAAQALCFREPDIFDLYIGDLKRGNLVLIKNPGEYLRIVREAFQNYNDVLALEEAVSYWNLPRLR